MKKSIVVMMTASMLVLAACGSNKEEKPKVIEQVIPADLTEATTAYKTEVLTQMTPFLEDIMLLEQYINEDKLEDAKKLYPLVHMYVERLQPLKTSFSDKFAEIDAVLQEGKELDGKGFHAVEYSLFEAQATADIKDVVAALVKDVKELTNELAQSQLDGQDVLNGTSAMLQETIERKLAGTGTSYASTQVYDVKATVEGTLQVVDAFKKRAGETETNALASKLTAVNEVIAYYEVGKEDYVNYSFFTSTQKQELMQAMTEVKEAFDAFNQSIK